MAVSKRTDADTGAAAVARDGVGSAVHDSAGDDAAGRDEEKTPKKAGREKKDGKKGGAEPAKGTAKKKSGNEKEKSAGNWGAKEWTRQDLLSLYRRMLQVRRFEEKAGQLYGLGLIGGFCHLYIGQEAVVIGAEAARGPGDCMTTSYRAHGHALAVGGAPERIMGELLGRASGICGGKGGSMHLFDIAHGFYGGHGIVGAPVPLAAGLGFAKKYLGEEGISIAFFGDGALNQGQVYETFNMSALWSLPVLFLIENNKYGMGTSIERASAHSEALHARGGAYGIGGEKVDGMDVIAVHDAVAASLARIRGGGGPYILEAMTYRYRGHSMSDPAKYRSRDEVEDVRSHRDPIDSLGARLSEAGLLDETLRKEIDREVREEVNAAAEAAKAASEPPAEALWTDVYNAKNGGGSRIEVSSRGMQVRSG